MSQKTVRGRFWQTAVGLGLLLGMCGAASVAQAAPGGVAWRGTVDDVARVVVRGDQVREFTLSGRSTRDVDFRFRGDFLERNDRVRLQPLRGRGSLRVIQQPDSRNNFTTVIEVRDPEAGAAPYEFRLIWDSARDNRWDPWDRRNPWDRDDRGNRNDRWNRDNRDSRWERDDDRNDRDDRRESRAYREGRERGQQDFRRNIRPDYTRYRNQFNRQTEDDFRQGYRMGYRDAYQDNRRNDQPPARDRDRGRG
ncbi:MAG: hypothetical protein OHK0029_10260 [Armatimonadaceae bacterium]